MPDPTAHPSNAWLTTGQAAKLLGVSSPNTVKNWLQGGWFPGAIRTPGGHWRFLRADVDAVLASMHQLSTAPVAPGEVDLPDLDDDESVGFPR